MAKKKLDPLPQTDMTFEDYAACDAMYALLNRGADPDSDYMEIARRSYIMALAMRDARAEILEG